MAYLPLTSTGTMVPRESLVGGRVASWFYHPTEHESHRAEEIVQNTPVGFQVVGGDF